MSNNIENKEFCKRCCGDTGMITIMSIFNTDIICMSCSDKEKEHPDYKMARNAELEACKAGDYNFPGIGYRVI